MRFKCGDKVKDKIDGMLGEITAVLGFFEEGRKVLGFTQMYVTGEAGIYYEVETSDGPFAVWEGRLVGRLPDKDCYHPAKISIDDLMRGLKERETA